MKKQLFVLILSTLAIGYLAACKKNNSGNNDNNNNNIVKPVEVTIPFTDTTSLNEEIVGLPISLPIDYVDTFATKVDEFITPYGFKKDDITKVSAKYMTISIENNMTQTMNFIKDSVRIYVDSFAGITRY
jgi:hypothetical protein